MICSDDPTPKISFEPEQNRGQERHEGWCEEREWKGIYSPKVGELSLLGTILTSKIGRRIKCGVQI